MSATRGIVTAGIRELTEIIGVFDSRHRVPLRGVLSRTPLALQTDARRLTSNRVLRQSTGLHDNYFDTLSEADGISRDICQAFYLTRTSHDCAKEDRFHRVASPNSIPQLT